MSMTRRHFMKKLGVVGGAAVLNGCSPEDTAQGHSVSWEPAYTQLQREGRLAERVQQAYRKFEQCDLCPRRCGARRSAGETGFCGATTRVKVYSHNPHFGEELPLVGRGGSGTIFFSHCNLRCVFCQNWPIAHLGHGREIRDAELAELMLDLQRRGCHNINVVTPTHVMPNILSAVHLALKKGLRLPICYNTGGYERAENIKLLDGIVDIYLPDLKFMDSAESARYAVTGPEDYPEMAQQAILEMHRQVGELVTDDRGLALRGLMIRHLVMPNRVAGTREFVAWVAEHLPRNTYVNIMAQYRVEHRAFEHERIARAITSQEFLEAIDWAEQAGLSNLDERSLAMARMHRRRLG
ncbi:MAG: twin-arginine translocation signal domain-containing protein [Planctomycetes bacterium]|nr:twin-arginine translocation signal domain-containing protein [Planctomycetota bacterium]